MSKIFKFAAGIYTILSLGSASAFAAGWCSIEDWPRGTLKLTGDCPYKMECFNYINQKWVYDQACHDGKTPPKTEAQKPAEPAQPANVAKVPLQPNDWKNCAGAGTSAPGPAIAACGQVMQDPRTNSADYAMAASLLSQGYYRNANYDMTIKMATSAISVNKDLSLPYLSRGNAYFQQDQYQKAIDDYTRGIANYAKPTKTNFPNNRNLSDYYSGRAMAYQLQKNKTSAALDYRRAHAIEPSSSFAEKKLEQLQDPQPPRVSDSCISLSEPTPGGVGCAPGKQWFWTSASVRHVQGCPSSMLIEYLAPDTSQFEQMSIPARLQTCGEGVRVARSKE